MDRLKKISEYLRRRRIGWLAAGLLAAGVAVAQQASPPAQTNPPAQAAPQVPSTPPSQAAPPAQATPSAQAAPPAGQSGKATPEQNKPEHLVTEKEAKELFRSVDKITRFASKETKLPIRDQVKRELVNRDQVE